MEKYDYSTLKKLGKDELIYLISVIERDIRKEYEKYTVPSVELYYIIKKLFQDKEKLIPLPHEFAIFMLMNEAINKISLDPVLLKLKFDDVNVEEVELEGIEDPIEYQWAKDLLKTDFWNAIIVTDIKQIICINGDGVNHDTRSVSANVKDEDLRSRMDVSNNKVTLRQLTELIYLSREAKSTSGMNSTKDFLLIWTTKEHFSFKSTLIMDHKSNFNF